MGAFRTEKKETRYHVVLPPDTPLRTPRSLAPVRTDFVDAEFEVIPGHASRRPPSVYNDNFDRPKNNVRTEAAPEKSGLFTQALLSVDMALRRISSTAFAGMTVLVFVTVFWAIGSVALARLVPQMLAAPAASSPLVISKARLSLHQANGRKVLQISAQIRNQSDRVHLLPPVRLQLTPGVNAGSSMILSPLVSRLAPGETTGIVARYAYSGGKLPVAQLAFDAKAVPAL
jgi:hypothetical protein